MHLCLSSIYCGTCQKIFFQHRSLKAKGICPSSFCHALALLLVLTFGCEKSAHYQVDQLASGGVLKVQSSPFSGNIMSQVRYVCLEATRDKRVLGWLIYLGYSVWEGHTFLFQCSRGWKFWKTVCACPCFRVLAWTILSGRHSRAWGPHQVMPQGLE